MPKITTCLWFDNEAEEAVRYYTSIFDNSKVLDTSYYWEGGPRPAGTVLTVTFEIEGREFMALNGGPEFKFNESVSLVVHCKDQEEIDRYWQKLSAVPESEQCGWLKDKFGVSWQIVPKKLNEMISNGDAERSARVLNALMPMKKLDLRTLEEAYKG